MRRLAIFPMMLTLLLAAGCDGGPGADPDAGSGGADGGQEVGTTTITGTVLDASSRPVGDATVAAGAVSAVTDWQGTFTLENVSVDVTALETSADWFAPASTSVTLTEGTPHAQQLVLSTLALEITQADQALATSYNQSFDWTTDEVSIEMVRLPSRGRIDAALYLRNPALYQDTSSQAQVTPTRPPTLAGAPANFDFPIPAGGANEGQLALDVATLVDSLDSTPLTAAEKEDFLVWRPAVELHLINADFDAAATLYYAGRAITGQTWGSSATIPTQSLRRIFLHEGELWVELVFENHLMVGAGITDTDGDGRKEVFGRIAAAHVNASAYALLGGDYASLGLTVLELRDNLGDILDDLYSQTMPSVVSVLGVPYEIAGTGTVEYPFVVLRHSDGKVNVLLVEP